MRLILIVAALTVSACRASYPVVEFDTDAGPIRFEVFADRSPLTSANFLRYVDEGRYDSASFYRAVRLDNQPDDSVRIQVIQGGLGFSGASNRLGPIPHETTRPTGVRHLDGTLSMARSAPGTASSEIFICIGDQAELDFGGRRNPDGQGFAAFGRVVAGMEVVRTIQRLPAEGQMLEDPVRVLAVRRVR